MKKMLIFVMTFVMATAIISSYARDVMSDTWVGQDELGRSFGTQAEVGAPKSDKTVCMFYYIWHSKSLAGKTLHDITKILDGTQEKWGGLQQFHYWGEPFMGYYSNEDEIILRKHAQLLTDAGVDVICFDFTNGSAYPDEVIELIKVWGDMRAEGNDTPYITCFAGAPENSIVPLYAKILNPNTADASIRAKAEDLWFKWRGRKLIIGPNTPTLNVLRGWYGSSTPEYYALDDMVNNWTARACRTLTPGNEIWTWLDFLPVTASTAGGQVEEVSVTTAFHPDGLGKSAGANGQPSNSNINPKVGTYFQEQWDDALAISPPFVFVTQWNEWLAQRFTYDYYKEYTGGAYSATVYAGNPITSGDTNIFPDCYNWEFNRDIEPMKNDGEYGWGDNYYYQLVENVRKYKGVRAIPAASAEKTISFTGDFSQWSSVAPTYYDDLYDTKHRDFAMSAIEDYTREEDEYYYVKNEQGYYKNTTGRNDFDIAKTARDDGYVYFYISTREDITAYEADSAWMNLMINTDGNYANGWYGYDYIIGREFDPEYNLISVEKNLGGYSWKEVGFTEAKIEGNEMMVAIPREWIEYKNTESISRTIDFKWVDHVPVGENGFDPLDYIDKGDVAPNGRFNYRYNATFSPARAGGLAITMDTIEMDITDGDNISERILSVASQNGVEASSVTYITEPRYGAMSNGIYTPDFLLGPVHECLRYHLLDQNGSVKSFGNVIIKNDSSANIFNYTGALSQMFVADHANKKLTLYLSYTTKLWDVVLTENVAGEFKLNDVVINGTNVFNFRRDGMTDLTLSYTEAGKTVSYTLDIVRNNPADQVVNTPNNLAGTALPGNTSLWAWADILGTTPLGVAQIFEENALAPKEQNGHILWSTKEQVQAPYTLTFRVVNQHSDTSPARMAFACVRNTTNREFPTTPVGIWYGIRDNQFYLRKNTENFAANSTYSIAKVSNMKNPANGFVGVRVVDNGDVIKMYVEATDGSFVHTFTLDNFTTTSFRYTNHITGEISIGYSQGIVQNGGHMAFFHHGGGLSTYWNNINFVSNQPSIPLTIDAMAVLDSDYNEITNSVIIDNTQNKIWLSVDNDALISSVWLEAVGSVNGTRMMLSGANIAQRKVNLTTAANSSAKLIVVGGGVTRTYTVYVIRNVDPQISIAGTTDQTVETDNFEKTITVLVGDSVDLSALSFVTSSSGTFTIDGKSSDTVFDFSKNNTGHKVIYKQDGVSVTYTMNIYKDITPPSNADIYLKGVDSQSTQIDNKAKTITITVPAGTSLENVAVSVPVGVTATLDDVNVKWEWFNLDETPAGHILTYSDGGYPIEYTFDIQREALPEQNIAQVNSLLAGNALPGSNDAWEVISRSETSAYKITTRFGESCMEAPSTGNHLLATKAPVTAPYIFEYEASVTEFSYNTWAPHAMAFNCIRNGARDAFTTDYNGIWYGVFKNYIYLLVTPGGVNFADPGCYAIATIPNRTSAAESFVPVRVVDNGATISIKAKDDDGVWVECFELSSITANSFNYRNCISGASGTAKSKNIQTNGYISFFHHAESTHYYKNLALKTGAEPLSSKLEAIYLCDYETGTVVSTDVQISGKTVTVSLAPGVDATSLVTKHYGSVSDTTLFSDGVDTSFIPLDYSKDRTLTYSDGEVTIAYTVKTVYDGAPVLKAGKSFTAKMNGLNKTKNACVYLAFFDENNRLLRVERQFRMFDTGLNIKKFTLPQVLPEGAVSVKIISIADNEGHIEPMSEIYGF